MTISLDYITGLMDGEGSIGIAKHEYKKKNGKTQKYFYLNCCIANKNMECLRLSRDLLGYGKLYFRKQDQIYILKFNEKETVELLKTIGHKLIVKKEEARLIEQFMLNKEEIYYTELRNRRRGHKTA